MHFFDFLSDSPKIFIFQKKTNKTNFGGILFLIYIIIMILISIAYILAFAFNEKYTVEAFTYYNHTENIEELESMNNDKELNPYIVFTLRIKNKINLSVSLDGGYSFIDKDYIDDESNSYTYIIKNRISDIYLSIYYNCGSNSTCENAREFLHNYNSSRLGDYSIEYPRYKIYHSDEPPVQKDCTNVLSYTTYSIGNYIGLKNIKFEWEVIK